MRTDLELSDFVIASPYELTKEDQEIIEKVSKGNPDKDQWDDSRLKSFKERVKDYYDGLQNQKCAYCRMDVSTATGYYHIEHIAPKSSYPQWMYDPRNLCLACPYCNSAKNDKEVLSRPCQELPTESNAYIIVNPHLDKYFDQITVIDELLYQGITEKGKKTIEICNLTRMGLLLERAKNKIEQEQTDGTFTKILLLYSQHPEAVQDLPKLTEKIIELKDRYL